MTTMYVYTVEESEEARQPIIAVITGDNYEVCYECYTNSYCTNDYFMTTSNDGSLYEDDDTVYLAA